MDDDWRLGHRPGLDQLRGIAVGMVLVGHGLIGGPLGWAASIGVVTFFTLSGFLITRLLVEERRRTGRLDRRRFYARRARRLLPALVMALPLCALVNARYGAPVAVPFIASTGYVANYAALPSLGVNFFAFEHLWSLAVEEQFYLVWPWVIGLIAPRRLLPWALGLAGLVAVSRWVVFTVGVYDTYRPAEMRADAMLLGAALAASIHWMPRPPRVAVAASAAMLLVWSNRAMEAEGARYGFALVALASAVLIADAVHWKARWTGLTRLGVISYGVYLFHVPVALVLRHEYGFGSGPALLAAVTAFSVVMAEVSFRWIEQPLRRPSGEPPREAVPDRRRMATGPPGELAVDALGNGRV